MGRQVPRQIHHHHWARRSGILGYSCCIGFWLPSSGKPLTMRMVMVPGSTRWYGIVGPDPKLGGLIDSRAIEDLASIAGPAGFLDNNWVSLDRSQVMMSNSGLSFFLSPYWSSLRLFFLPFVGQKGRTIWVDLGFVPWKSSCCLKIGLGTACYLERRCLRTDALVGLSQLAALLSLRVYKLGRGVSSLAACFAPSLVLHGGLARFIPGGVGSHLSRLRQSAWLQCGHGLSARPLESCLPDCLDSLLGLLDYPPGAITELANGGLILWYCNVPFASRFLPWCLGNGNASCRSSPSMFSGLIWGCRSIFLFQREWMILLSLCVGVVTERRLFIKLEKGWLARLRSEGNGCTCLGV